MEELPSDPLARLDAMIERKSRQADAQFALLSMDNFEKVAKNYECLGETSGVISAEVATQRRWFGELYRDAIGVPIERRHELRPLLKRLAETGEQVVEEEIHRCKNQTQNGFSSSDADLSESDTLSKRAF